MNFRLKSVYDPNFNMNGSGAFLFAENMMRGLRSHVDFNFIT